MSLYKFMKTIFFFTVLALVYIHMQMQIFAMAYEGKKREKEIISLSERNGVLAYEILSLKSASNLGQKMLNQETSLRFRDNGNVVQLVTTQAVPKTRTVIAAKPQKVNPILSFFNLRAEAEARPAENADLIKPWRRDR